MSHHRVTTSLGAAELGALVAAVSAMTPAVDDGERIDRIRHFEELKSAIAAAQAAETAAFVVSQRAAQAVLGVPPERQNRGIAAQIALAKRCSHHAAQRYTGWSIILTRELPGTFAELRAGRTSELRAMTVAKETLFLTRDGRARVDRALAPRLESMSDRAVEVAARKAGYALDPEGSLARSRHAVSDRHVSIRPAPDTMVRLSALLPVAQGVACYASLSRTADTARSASGGDPRSRAQVMADTVVERLTGQATADAVPVEVELLIGVDALLSHPGTGADTYEDDDEAFEDESSTRVADIAATVVDLLARGGRPATAGQCSPHRRTRNESPPTPASRRDEPALITAPGLSPVPIPAGLARELVQSAPQAWLRRLFTRPETGDLVAMQTDRRLFTDAQKHFLRHRDQHCATPWCGAPVRHADHVIRAEHGGPTRLDHGRGLCEACNHAGQAPGWRSTPNRDGSIDTTTPTGHTYRRPPPRPFAPARPDVADPISGTNRARIEALVRTGRLGRIERAAQ